jgi:TetR/AcrR family transcriptional repressor of nem operon
MARPSNREKILDAGLRVVHERGFQGASVRDIVEAAGVPQGSFTNHFASKEAFGVEVIDRYFESGCEIVRETLLDASRPPLERLADYIDRGMAKLNEHGMRQGCLLGNIAAEAAEHSEPIRRHLLDAFAENREAIASCLEAAVAAGELPAGFDTAETAAFIVSGLQGANLIAKAERSTAPVERFKRVLFERVLR